jgi:hypothetical protein
MFHVLHTHETSCLFAPPPKSVMAHDVNITDFPVFVLLSFQWKQYSVQVWKINPLQAQQYVNKNGESTVTRTNICVCVCV